MTPLDHEDAKEIVDGLPGLEPIDSLFVRMVAFHETRYGRGWQGAGADSHNWGAITFAPKGEASESCAGGFAHEDSRFDAKAGKVVRYVTCFRSYQSDEAGAADVARVALKGNVREAIRTGRVSAGASAMHANRYFLGTKPTVDENVADYTRALERAKAAILAETGEPDPFAEPGEPGSEDSSPGVELLASWSRFSAAPFAERLYAAGKGFGR